MTIFLGPTEHIDHPENLMGSGALQRSRLKSYMERQKDQQLFGQHPAPGGEAFRRRMLPERRS